MPNLMNYYVYNDNHDEQDILAKIARYHIEFERIIYKRRKNEKIWV